MAAQGQPYTVLVGPLRRRLVAPDVPSLATAAVAYLRRPGPTGGHAVVGAPTEEATTGAMKNVLVGLPLPVTRAVELEVVAA